MVFPPLRLFCGRILSATNHISSSSIVFQSTRHMMQPGVPDFEYPSLDQGAIMAELEKKYPDFEKRTGWRLDSAYKKQIPADLEKEVG